MFSHYLIQKENGEDVLYLYLNYQYEFSKEFSTYHENDLKVLSHQFIETHHIPFKGNKVYFVVDGIVVKKTDIQDQKGLYYTPDSFMITLELEDHSFCEVSLRDYLTSILFSYYSQDIGDEVLKSICILFNTYCYRCMAGEGKVFAQNMFGYYQEISFYQDQYQNFEAIQKRINKVIDQSSCLFLAYHQEYILPFIHYSNNGKTLSNIKYPYLTSVKSLWDIASPIYLHIYDYDYSTLSNLLKVKLDSSSPIKILNNGNSMKFGYRTFSIHEIKDMLSLPSNDITIIVNRNMVRFITKGNGNALGLSIYGAMCIEENGGKYEDILHYYFPKCILYKNIKELS